MGDATVSRVVVLGCILMQIITIDFETYFDDEFSLKKMTTEAYVRDPRFEVHGAAVKDASGTRWESPQGVKALTEAWQDDGISICMLAHHAHFDGLILSHVFDYCPNAWLDTLSMGRVVFEPSTRLGLEALVEKFGLKPKSVPYDLFKGKHWHELDGPTQRAVADGACHDADLTAEIAGYMLAGHPVVPYPFPVSELPVVDLTVRMFTEPSLVGDLDKLGAAWVHEEKERQALFANAGITGPELRKDAIFAALLEAEGVEVATKVTPKGNEKYAFAKSDWFMQDLLTHENERVVLLTEARLKAQSSIYQTRAERLGFAAQRGPLPVYLAYAAAHTRRWGGGDKMNWQNFPRSDPYRPNKGALRRAIGCE